MEKFVNNLMRHMASKESNWTIDQSERDKKNWLVKTERNKKNCKEETLEWFFWHSSENQKLFSTMKIEAGGVGVGDVGDKTTPKDALVMAAILRDMGITEYEPRVINQVRNEN